MGSPFDFDTAGPARTRRQGVSYLGLFAVQFAATLLAGIVLLVGLRFYVHWSIADWASQVGEKVKAADRPAPAEEPASAPISKRK